MKKLRNNIVMLVISISIIAYLSSCVDGETDFKYYRFKNDSGSSIKLKFYSNFKILGGFDSLIIENKKYSEEFYESSGVPSQDFFINNVDSIDFVLNEVLAKRYKKTDGIESKSPYSTKYFETEEVGSYGKKVHVYTILSEDFMNK